MYKVRFKPLLPQKITLQTENTEHLNRGKLFQRKVFHNYSHRPHYKLSQRPQLNALQRFTSPTNNHI